LARGGGESNALRVGGYFACGEAAALVLARALRAFEPLRQELEAQRAVEKAAAEAEKAAEKAAAAAATVASMASMPIGMPLVSLGDRIILDGAVGGSSLQATGLASTHLQGWMPPDPCVCVAPMPPPYTEAPEQAGSEEISRCQACHKLMPNQDAEAWARRIALRHAAIGMATRALPEADAEPPLLAAVRAEPEPEVEAPVLASVHASVHASAHASSHASVRAEEAEVEPPIIVPPPYEIERE